MKKIYSLAVLSLLATVSTAALASDSDKDGDDRDGMTAAGRQLSHAAGDMGATDITDDTANSGDETDDKATTTGATAPAVTKYFDTDTPDLRTATSVLINLIKDTNSADDADDDAAPNQATLKLVSFLDHVFALDQSARTQHCSFEILAAKLAEIATAEEQLAYLTALSTREGHTGTIIAAATAEEARDGEEADDDASDHDTPASPHTDAVKAGFPTGTQEAEEGSDDEAGDETAKSHTSGNDADRGAEDDSGDEAEAKKDVEDGETAAEATA